MIIGISGKIGSGKDTIGKIVQYLIARKYYDDLPTTKKLQFKVDTTPYVPNNFQIKKFAGKLKEIIAIITGCSISDLELQEFKGRLLSDEWQVYELYNFNQPVGKTKGISRVVTFFSTEQEARDFCDEKTNSQHQFTYKKTERTYRWLLQQVGTEAMRDIIHPNVWANALFSDYNSGAETTDRKGPHDNWIITDVRFANELQAIKARGGITIRVNRIGSLSNQNPILLHSNHPSETALDNATFDYIIENNGTIEELVEVVRKIMVECKVL